MNDVANSTAIVYLNAGNGVCLFALRKNRLHFSADNSYQSNNRRDELYESLDGRINMLNTLIVAIGGAIGSVARYWVSGLVADRMVGRIFPWNTFAVNVTGSFIIGILAAFTLAEGRVPSTWRPFVVNFLMVGFCGGYTTFSSFSLQTLTLINDREWLFAGGNILLSVITCMIGVWLGYVAGQLLNR
jgi:fluoride exporter